MTFRQKLDEERRDAYAEGVVEGVAKGDMSRLRSDLQNLIQHTGWSLEQAMTALNVSDADQKKYMKMLDQQQ